MKYRYIKDLTSDVMFEAYGRDFRELLENAAYAMFETICQQDKVKPEKKVLITAKGSSEKELLVDWLQKLIAAVDTEEMFFSRFTITGLKDNRLKAEIYGEPVEPSKGETVVKAVTYYKLALGRGRKGYTARVSLDI